MLEPATPQQACRWATAARALDTALAQAVPMAADLVPALGKPDSCATWSSAIARAIASAQSTSCSPTPAVRLQAAVKRTVERAETLYGRLEERAEAQSSLPAWRHRPSTRRLWLAERQAAQRDTLQTLARLTAGGPARADRESNLAGLQALARARAAFNAQPVPQPTSSG